MRRSRSRCSGPCRRQRLRASSSLPPPGGPGDSEEGRAAQDLEKAPGTDPGGILGQTAPLQKGMQALPAEEVANEGARALRKVNLEQFKAKLRDQYLEGKGVDASQALADAMGSIQEAQEANKRTQHTNQAWMLNHTLRCRHGQMISGRLWRGGCSAPWSWMTPRTSPTWGTSRRSTSPTSGGSERRRTRGTERTTPSKTTQHGISYKASTTASFIRHATQVSLRIVPRIIEWWRRRLSPRPIRHR